MKRMLTALVLSLSLLVASGGVGYAGEGARAKSENDVATMYRSSPVIDNARTHMATFDGDEKAYEGSRFDYNWYNCQLAAKLFNSQQDVISTFWCEKGFYKE